MHLGSGAGWHLPALSWLPLALTWAKWPAAIKFELFAWIMAAVDIVVPELALLPFTNCDCGRPIPIPITAACACPNVSPLAARRFWLSMVMGGVSVWLLPFELAGELLLVSEAEGVSSRLPASRLGCFKVDGAAPADEVEEVIPPPAAWLLLLLLSRESTGLTGLLLLTDFSLSAPTLESSDLTIFCNVGQAFNECKHFN